MNTQPDAPQQPETPDDLAMTPHGEPGGEGAAARQADRHQGGCTVGLAQEQAGMTQPELATGEGGGKQHPFVGLAGLVTQEARQREIEWTQRETGIRHGSIKAHESPPEPR